jgi:MFS family permease
MVESKSLTTDSKSNLAVQPHKLANGLTANVSYAEPRSESQVDHDPFLVKFGDGDPENPMNFSGHYKAWLTAQMALLAFVGSFGSSIASPAEPVISKYLDVTLEATVLLVSLFVLGYAFGPMLWAPISEVYGRKISMIPAIFVLGLFSIGTAVSNNAASVFITRFLGGLFGSAAISNVSAAIGDFYPPKTRGIPMALMAVCVVGGPCLAPLAGAAITINPHLGWRCKISRCL